MAIYNGPNKILEQLC